MDLVILRDISLMSLKSGILFAMTKLSGKLLKMPDFGLVKATCYLNALFKVKNSLWLEKIIATFSCPSDCKNCTSDILNYQHCLSYFALSKCLDLVAYRKQNNSQRNSMRISSEYINR